MADAKLDEEKKKPTSQIGMRPIAHSAVRGIATTVDGAQSQQRLGKQAKAIMDEFVKALDKVGGISGEVGLEREETTRQGAVKKHDESFKERMLKNAPRTADGQILAEKKSW
ncbi:MAG TPA: hypothetical protein VI934_01360 [Candidatus Nanoarchaeia archaeon]|nr:hypothetical protein [Candidatus Nanoarchaeia archaeon]